MLAAVHQPAGQSPPQQQQQRGPQHRRPAPLDLAQAMPLVERALQALERRSVRPQLGLLKSTMLQLDSAFSEKAYGSGSFTDFVEKLQKANYVQVTGGEGRYMIKRVGAVGPEKTTVRPEAALPVLRDVLETHRMEVDEGVPSDALAEWVKQEHPDYDWKQYGFQEFSELLNYAQDKLVVRVNPDEEKGLMVYLGPEFHPPAPPEPPPEPVIEEEWKSRSRSWPDSPRRPGSSRTCRPRRAAAPPARARDPDPRAAEKAHAPSARTSICESSFAA
jgi:hypothetical protein